MDKIYIQLEDRTCKLCNREAESHEHLFFQCSFSSRVWRTIFLHDYLFRLPVLPWSQLLEWASTAFHSPKLITHMIGPLILAAIVYHYWQERNTRIFNNNARSASSISNDIYQQIETNSPTMEVMIKSRSPPWQCGISKMSSLVGGFYRASGDACQSRPVGREIGPGAFFWVEPSPV
ncbi:hypothetical protein OIU76_018228 [Salix suchowensis]|nr:hypothetical protein OIU76_018228 [Salix suchowensis]